MANRIVLDVWVKSKFLNTAGKIIMTWQFSCRQNLGMIKHRNEFRYVPTSKGLLVKTHGKTCACFRHCACPAAPPTSQHVMEEGASSPMAT
jgi:hypothetical protein